MTQHHFRNKKETKTTATSMLLDAWNMPHPKDCACYKCTCNPESFGFILVNKECSFCKIHDDRKYCESQCVVKLRAIEKYKTKKGEEEELQYDVSE